MNFPVDTRLETKTTDNRQFSTYSYQQPIQQSLQNPSMFDRNYFQMNHQTTNLDTIRQHNPTDRLFETSQIYRNFGSSDAQPQQQQPQKQPSHFQQTRESKSNIIRGDEASSRVFIDIPHRNYSNDISQRISGFGIVPKDTRYENEAKSKTNDTSNMRTTRYFGTPSNNL
jgi:hypothetical protein